MADALLHEEVTRVPYEPHLYTDPARAAIKATVGYLRERAEEFDEVVEYEDTATKIREIAAALENDAAS